MQVVSEAPATGEEYDFEYAIMTMFSRRPRPRTREGVPTGRRPKRVKTIHTAEDQVIQEFQDILGHLRSGNIGGPSLPQYDGAMEEERHIALDSVNPPEDALPEANLKSVPHDSSLQALWIAREIKKLAVYNEKHIYQNRAGSISTASPVSPTFSLGVANATHVDQNETPDSSLKSFRSSGRKRRQTSKAKDSHLIDLNVDDQPPILIEANRNPMDGLDMLSALVTNQRVQHALLYSVNLGPGNFEKRSTFGTQFLQSMAADTIPPDPMPAAKLKHSLWRSRNHVPFFAALHILAGFEEVVHAIDVAFQGRLDESTPLTKREAPLHDYTQRTYDAEINGDAQVNADAGQFHLNGDLRHKRNSFSTRVKPVHRKPGSTKTLTPIRPSFFPGLAPKPTICVDMSQQNNYEPYFETAEPEGRSEGSVVHEVTGPMHFTPVDSKQSRKAIGALIGATAILDDMAYGALKYSFIPQANGPPNSQYLTPYGPPGPNTYVTPYSNPSPSQQNQVIPNPVAPQQVSAEPQLSGSNTASNTEIQRGTLSLHGTSFTAHDVEQQIPDMKGKGKEKAQEPAPGPIHILKTTETARSAAEATGLTAFVSNQEDEDGEEDFTQIDSFLALAAGNDSDSDDETDRDKTISREMTPVAPLPGDPALQSIVQGIIGELNTNQNWGHGIGFLTPQTHLYQISNAHRFAEGLRRCIDDASVGINCVLSAEHSRAQEALFHALIKRITNPYVDGTLPHYSNVVYHNGRAYQAIPGPAHPMYQQQLPYPPPPPPSSQMMLPSQASLPMTPPVDLARRASSSRLMSTGQTLKMFREFTNQRPASQAPSPQIQSRRSSEDFLTRDPRSRNPLRPAALQDYESSESDHAPIHIRSPLKRKRVTE